VLVVVALTLPGELVAVYDVMGLPPVLLGGVQLTVAELLPAVAVTAVGAAGAPAAVGVTEFEGTDGGPEPCALVATTVNV
jgi:hypothetical protein